MENVVDHRRLTLTSRRLPALPPNRKESVASPSPMKAFDAKGSVTLTGACSESHREFNEPGSAGDGIAHLDDSF